VSPTEITDLIEMQFGLWTQVGPRNHVLDGAWIHPVEGAILGVVPPIKNALQQQECRKQLCKLNNIHITYLQTDRLASAIYGCTRCSSFSDTHLLYMKIV